MADCILNVLFRTLRSRRECPENGNNHTSSRVVPTVFGQLDPPHVRHNDKAIDSGLSEVDDIRSQLMALQTLVQAELTAASDGDAPPKETGSQLAELIRENDALRRQLIERDQVIRALRSQLQALKVAT